MASLRTCTVNCTLRLPVCPAQFLPEAGHINAESLLGEWPEGKALLQELRSAT
ncbi:hypothetical protein GPA22_21325 [Aromatoleum toluvorans]|uniref:Uncharacterized protein n=1 Tax=Aromatoleum toluvorans TaxID=92002 RepID=A0ABX1Q7A3_9RHOO|nr:hypothetical protein [Aromatoleum toluvorans]